MRHPSSPPTVEELLAHADWVRALAARLAADPNDAEDLVQDTWLATLRSPPAQRRDLRAWLGTLVRNFHRQRQRSEARRVRRERALRPDAATPSTSELVEWAELQREVVEAVLALDEPARSTVLLRYFEGMPAREIAAQQGIPVETVRTRLKRAHATLRVRVHAQGRDRGRAWSALVMPVAGSADPHVAAGAAGALILGTSMKVVTVAAVVVAAFFVISAGKHPGDGADPGGDAASRVADASRLVASAATREAWRARGGVAARRQRSAMSPHSVAGWVLHGELVGLLAAAPWTTTLVVEGLPAEPSGEAVRFAAAVDTAGRFTCELRRPADTIRAVRVTADDPRYMVTSISLRPCDVVRSALHPIQLEVVAADVLSGVVRNERGQLVPLARLGLFAVVGGKVAEMPLVESACDAAGAFRMRSSYRGPCLLVASSGMTARPSCMRGSWLADGPPRGYCIPIVWTCCFGRMARSPMRTATW